VVVLRVVMLFLVLVALPAGEALTPVSLQLKYYHQFQFAGYYAADLRGFYAEEGLQVDIRELRPGMVVEDELTSGRVAFMSFSPLILERWAQGADLFLMAFIHQRNPHALLVRSTSAYHHLRDIVSLPAKRRVAPATGIDIDLWLGLTDLGIDPQGFFPRLKQPEDFDRFIRGELDVLPGFLSNEPARCRDAGVDVRPLTVMSRSTITPGDALVCTGERWRTNPQMVEAFRRASLRGWDYALLHPQELIDHITAKRTSLYQRQSREHLAQEAITTAELIDLDRFPLGHINHERLETMATLLSRSGIPARVPQELVYVSANASARWLMWLGALLAAGAVGLITLAVVTRRQHRSLAESKIHYQNLIDAADGYFAFRARISSDADLRLDLASRSIEGILGHPLAWYQERKGRLLEQVPEEDRAMLRERLAELRDAPTGQVRLRLRISHPSHQAHRNLVLNATPMRTADGTVLDGVCIDFTSETLAESERAMLQQQLQNAQRNESLGLLASGVAHDFNNILSAIRGNAELLGPQIPPSHKHRLDRLFQAVDRASGLVRQILAYSGRGRVENKPLDLGEELQQIDALIRHALPKEVQTVLNLEPNLPPVMFDPAQFQQVAVNLIVNAAESYGGQPGEVQVLLDRHGDRLRLQVIDQGCGMTPTTMARIFDPYFTTKDHGHGLGLAAVQGIITGASGSITCESAPGQGTAFTVLLTPCASATSRSIATPSPELPDGVQYALVGDDDELVREITVETLNGLGYTCLQASGGRECIRILSQERPRICLLVLDCRMPDIDGITVLKRLREQGDRLPVILISGMLNIDSVSPLLRDRRTRFLAKPFSQEQLAATLEALFGSQIYRRRDSDSSRTAVMVADIIRQRQQEVNRRDAEESSAMMRREDRP
jgi:signal transduction histidine kinase/FixJ family two-component response regulator/ABC-type nitrate/sulfonate/bicarbonate transport system substrate-binding protein